MSGKGFTKEGQLDTLTGFEEIHPPLSSRAAMLESERCLECGGPLELAPCVASCPSRVDIPRFIREIRDGKPIEAAATIFASNGLGGSCARVCPVQELCEGACVMRKEGRRPVEIGRLQRFATDEALQDLKTHEKMRPIKTREASIGVIGAGPAGLACAEELALLGYEVTIYEKRKMPGGLITHGIAPYKQRIDPLLAEAKRIEGLGIGIRYNIEVGSEITLGELNFLHSALFVGVGMGPDTRSGLPGENLSGVWESLELIEHIKLGNTKNLHLGDKVAVIGGGNTAIDVVRNLVRLGVKDVCLIYRRDEASMPAYRHEVEAARKEGVKFFFQSAPVRFFGDKHVRAVQCVRMELGEPDASGRRSPIAVEGSEFGIEADSVVTAIGQSAYQPLFDALRIHTKKGIVDVNEQFHTSSANVFAGGDCINGGCTVVEAVRHGKLAARGIHSYLSGNAYKEPEPPREGEIRLVDDGPFRKRYQGGFYLATSEALCKGCNLCVNSCPTQILSLDAKSKIQVSDVAKCVFCGLCEMRCPDFAIWISKDEARAHPVEIEARRRLAL